MKQININISSGSNEEEYIDPDNIEISINGRTVKAELPDLGDSLDQSSTDSDYISIRELLDNLPNESIKLPAVDNKEAIVLAPPIGGIIYRGSQLMDMPLAKFVDLVLYNQINLPLDEKSTEIVKFIPGHTVAGTIGPSSQCDVLVLGKMPNTQESNYGQFHPDKIGNVWKPYLKAKGLNIDNWFLYCVVPFKVPDHLAGKGALKQCYLNETYCLLSEVYARVKPKFVLCFGADALTALYKLFDAKKYKSIKFTNSRGSVITLPDGTKVICCNSPGMILKDPNQTEEFNKDLDLLVEVIGTGGTSERRLSCGYQLIDTWEKLETYVYAEQKFQSQGKHKKYSLDMEWGANETLRTIQLATSNDYATVIHLSSVNLEPTELGKDLSNVLRILGLILKPKGIGIVGHNVRGDIKILRRMGLDLMPNFIDDGFDTMISYHLIPGNETLDKQLELVAIKMLNVGRYDKPLRDWLAQSGMSEKDKELLGYGTIPDEILIPYGAMDACVSYELYEVISKELPKYPKLEELYYKYQHVLNLPILEMEEGGMLIDQLRLKDLTRLFQTKVAELLLELQRKVNWEARTVIEEKTVRNKTKTVAVSYDGFNPDSPDQLKEILFGMFKEKKGVITRKAPQDALILNLVPVKATDDTPWMDVMAKGKQASYSPSTDSESLGILSSEHPLAKDIQRYKFVSQITKNFLRPFEELPDGTTVYDSGLGGSIGPDGRSRTSFRTVLETGRYSTSPNFNNLPKKQEKELQALFTSNGVVNPGLKSIKSVFIADPGWVFIESDYNQAELWTLAYVSRDKQFLTALTSSDLHTYNLQRMFSTKLYNGKPISEYTVDELNKIRKQVSEIESLRVASKSVK